MTQTQWTIILVLAGLSLFSLLGLLEPTFKDWYYRKRYRDIYGATLYRIAEDFDFQLVNPVRIKLDELNYLHIDHLLFGDKYIYVVQDIYYNGGLLGKMADKEWLFHHYDKKKPRYVKNPFLVNQKKIEKLSLVTSINESLFVSIVLVNNDAMIDRVHTGFPNSHFTNLKKLPKVIEAFENRKVAQLNAEKVQAAVYAIHQMTVENLKATRNSVQE